MARETRGVAWYDIPGKGYRRDLWVLMHWPYTLWHLSYVVIGAALVPVVNWSLLGWTVLAFFLGMGIAAHALDELNGRPLKTKLPARFLYLVAVLALLGAVNIGTNVGFNTDNFWMLLCILFGGFIVLAYNLEWPTEGMKVFILSSLPVGFFHRDIWFGVAWGAFPVITAYIVQTGTLSPGAVLVAVFALLYSMAQRKLSLQARFFRRKVAEIDGNYYLLGEQPTTPNTPGLGNPRPITKQTIIGPVDLGLKYMNGAVIAVAIGLLIMRMM